MLLFLYNSSMGQHSLIAVQWVESTDEPFGCQTAIEICAHLKLMLEHTSFQSGNTPWTSSGPWSNPADFPSLNQLRFSSSNGCKPGIHGWTLRAEILRFLQFIWTWVQESVTGFFIWTFHLKAFSKAQMKHRTTLIRFTKYSYMYCFIKTNKQNTIHWT